jgi:NAD(P)-dependent dehydrogenase (short-subunit alcohol dehydrogenase family)
MIQAPRRDPTADRRHALVVGAGPGVGAAIAGRFAAEGHRLTLVAREAGAVAELADRLSSGGDPPVAAVAADAADPYALRARLEPVFADRPPGIVIYHAGLADGDRAPSAESARREAAHAVNVVGAIVTAQLAAPPMGAAGGGTILFTAGAAAGASEAPSRALGRITLRAVAEILARQLAAIPVHVASVTIDAAAAGDPTQAERIAEACWRIHAEAPAQWRGEYLVGGA